MAPLSPYDLRTAAGRGPERFPAGHRWDSSPKIRFAQDSPLEGDGFEPSVPYKKQPFLAAPVRFRNSPSATKTGPFVPGTDGSNPSPSSAESANSSRQAITYAGTYQRLQGRRVAADTAIWYRKVRGNVGDMAGSIDRLTVGPPGARSISSCWASPAPFAGAVH